MDPSAENYEARAACKYERPRMKSLIRDKKEDQRRMTKKEGIRKNEGKERSKEEQRQRNKEEGRTNKINPNAGRKF